MANDENHIEQPANEATPAQDTALVEQSAPTEDAASNMPRPEDHPEHLPWPPKWREYPDDHPARQEEWTPNAPFNEDWARADFGDEFMARLKKEQTFFHQLMDQQVQFHGDWWLLSMLLRCTESARLMDPESTNANRLEFWNTGYSKFRGSNIRGHLERAYLPGIQLDRINLARTILEYACLSDSRIMYGNLTIARLAFAELRRTRLEYADLTRSRLQHADLFGACLEHAALKFTRLENATLAGAQLRNAKLIGANLEEANVNGSTFEFADSTDAHYEHAYLQNAIFQDAVLQRARLEHSDLSGVCFERANLRNASLNRAKLQGARLDHADVRGATGILFDNNPADRLHIEGNAPDPWSTLRREYTGPRFFFHLLLLVAFLLPYAARVLHLSALSEMHDVAERMVKHVETTPGHEPWAEALQQWTSRFRETHEPTLATWVLLGWTKWWPFFFLTLILILYNWLRWHLTSKVSALRDAEERSKITPSLEDYYGICHPLADRNELLGIRDKPREAPSMRDWPRIWCKRVGQGGWRKLSPVPVLGLFRVHQCARVLFWAAMLSFAINAFVWIATTTVWVPKG
jgi:uncharacterized protein YjbI with pentapeptide repeats